MDRTGAPASLAQFTEELHGALCHLYDIPHLETHWLARFVGDARRGSTRGRGRELNRGLREAIDSLRPMPGTPADSRAWRSFHLLEARYIEGRQVEDVLKDFGLSRTQYYREHNRGLEALASLLWRHWRLDELPPGEPRPAGPGDQERLALTRRELDDLRAHSIAEPLDLAVLLAEIQALLCPLCDRAGATLVVELPDSLPTPRGDRSILRLLLLDLLSDVVEGASGTVRVAAAVTGDGVRLTIAGPRRGIRAAKSAAYEHFATALGGRLADESDFRSFCLRLQLPLGAPYRVLVVDNHDDFVAFVARCLDGQNCEVVGAGSVDQALVRAMQLQPHVILLDIVMAGVDGWTLLPRLKQSRCTAHIPIVVCSVLRQPGLASSLGADGYLAKPVDPLTLVESLRPWLSNRPLASGLSPAELPTSPASHSTPDCRDG